MQEYFPLDLQIQQQQQQQHSLLSQASQGRPIGLTDQVQKLVGLKLHVLS